VAGKLGLPGDGKVYHLHPVGLIGQFKRNGREALLCRKCHAIISLTQDFISEISSRIVKPAFVEAMAQASETMFAKYGVDSCAQVTHLLAQAKAETAEFDSFRESLNYSRKSFTAEKLYALSPTVINAGLRRKGISFASYGEKMEWIDQNLIGDDSAYGVHCYGTVEQPGKDFRGRGLLHLTHYDTYKKCAVETGLAIDTNPELLESNFAVAIETALWFWKSRGIGVIADNDAISGSAAVKAVTRPINAGLNGLQKRQHYKKAITAAFLRHYGGSCEKVD
jgi:predicted chitinase